MSGTSDEQKDSIGPVETKLFTFGSRSKKIGLESGGRIGPINVAYETYGTLNPQKSNAILILHALSGDAHVAGFRPEEDKPGWWDSMIGPGKAFDTDKYFVICSNILGGCKGTTGPSSTNPETGRPYALDFPLITVRDIVDVQKRLIDHLGIRKLLSMSGGSMGGMQALQWVASYPEMVRSAIPISTSAKHSPQQIAFDEVGRQAIMADPRWNGGNYYGREPPERGLAVARMIGHITYMSDTSMKQKFGRRFNGGNKLFKFDAEFEVESYLRHKGDNFVKRFDANSYLYITKAMDYFDLAGDRGLFEALKNANSRFLVVAFESDWLYPAYQTREISEECEKAGLDSRFHLIPSDYGHDAFLLETEELSYLIKNFLDDVAAEAGITAKRSLEMCHFS